MANINWDDLKRRMLLNHFQPGYNSFRVEVGDIGKCAAATVSLPTTVYGGVAPYTYLWSPSTGLSSTTVANPVASHTSTITYTVTVTDKELKTTSDTTTVTIPSAIVVTNTATNITCFGAANGHITASVSGGMSPFTYLWSNSSTASSISSLTNSTYYVVVSDACGLTSSASSTITQPSILAVTMTSSDPTGSTATDGSATASVTGGTNPYTYLWSNSSTASHISGGVGTYSVLVTDAHSCTITGTVSLSYTAPSSGISMLARFIMNSANYVGPASTARSAYSTDGSTWTASVTPTNTPVNVGMDTDNAGDWSPTLKLYALAGYRNTTWGDPGTNCIITTPDGINWSNQTHPSFAASAVSWSSTLSKFIVVGQTEDTILESSNGINWTEVNTAASAYGLRDVTWASSLNLLLAAGYNGVYTSSTGSSWTQRTNTGLDGAGIGIVWAASINTGVMVSTNGTSRVSYSTNGTSWTASSGILSKAYYGVAWSPSLGMFAASMNNNGTSNIQTSTDGISWTTQTTPNRGLGAIEWSSDLGLFAAACLDASNGIITSPDGTNWTLRTSAGEPNPRAMGLIPARTVSIDTDAQAFFTTTGITDVSQQYAVNSLVLDLKSNNLWSKMDLIYPFIGGNATKHKYNLKNPVDSDAAFRATFVNESHSSTGVYINSTGGQAAVDTHYKTATSATQSVSISLYQTTNTTVSGYDIGAVDSDSTELIGINRFGSGNSYVGFGTNPANWVVTAVGSPQGLFTFQHVGGTTSNYRNATLIGSGARTYIANTASMGLGSRHGYDDTWSSPATAHEYSFVCAGTALTATEITNLNTIVTTYQALR